MLNAKKIGNAVVYRNLHNKLKAFHGGEQLTFSQINYNFLRRLEVNHYANDNKPGALSVYMRTLRALYNAAIKEGLAKPDHYPFRDYKIKNGDTKRRALNQQEFKQLKEVELKPGSALLVNLEKFEEGGKFRKVEKG